MAYIGRTPTPTALTSDDLTDNIVVTGKIADGTITDADITTANADRIAHTKITPPQYASLSALNSSYAASADNHGALAHAHAEGKVYFSHNDGSGYAWHPLANEDAELLAIGALAKTDGNVIVGNGSTWVAESGDTLRTSLGLAIGTNVQAYNANLADLTADQTFTAANRGTETANTDASFDMNVTNNFKCTLTGTTNRTISFTNLTAGQSGNIYFDNSASGSRTISKHGDVLMPAADLTAINTIGVYWLSYYSDGTKVLVTASAALT